MGKRRENRPTCHDCGAKEGELHQPGCDMERCPFCGRQLITCDCAYEKLGLFDRQHYSAATAFLPPEIYHHGLPPELEAAWNAMLEKQGRFPYIVYPNLCARCGQLWPEMFRVPDEEWARYIEPGMRTAMLCRKCYDYIKRVSDEAARKA